jgi:hypothetical protein
MCGRPRSARRGAGLREEVIDLIRAKGDLSSLPAEERDIVTYVRQLLRPTASTRGLRQTKNQHDAQWMVELTEVANYFAFLSGMVNPFEVHPPARRRQIAEPSFWVRPHRARRRWVRQCAKLHCGLAHLALR